jgi:hypothetical protein
LVDRVAGEAGALSDEFIAQRIEAQEAKLAELKERRETLMRAKG